MFKLEHQGAELLCITHPRTLVHPLCRGFAFSANHQEHRPRLGEVLVVDVISLRKVQVSNKETQAEVTRT